MLIALALLTALHSTPATDSIPGTWLLSGDVAGNEIKVTCVISQSGTTLSGNCSNATTPPLPLTGEAKDGKYTFQYEVDYQGQALTVIYSATFVSPKDIKGTIDVKPVGASGTFTATRAPAKP
ncbi:MAG: hypothetical protein ABI625_03615 [bacterium]